MAIKLVQKNQAGGNTPASPAMQEETKKGGVRLVRKDGTPMEDTSRKTMEFAGAQRSQAAAAKNDPLAEFNQIDPLAKDTQLQGMRDMYGQKNLNEYQKYMQKVQKGAWTSLPTVQDSEKFHAFTQLDDPKTAYTEARQKQIEKALPTLQHDQQSGYNRTQQIRHAQLEAQNETILKDSTENQIAYLEALADVDALTDAEKKNYKKLRKMLVQEAWKEFKNGNEARSNELDMLNMALSDKARNAAEAGIIGAADALTFGMLGKVTGETKKKAADLTQDQNVKQALQYSPTQWAQATHPKAYGVGSIAGSVAAMTGLGMAEGQILNGIKGFESLDKVVKSMIQSSTLFGSDAFLRSAAKQEWDEDFKTAIGNVAFDTASATASGIVSGALGGLTGQALDKWLRANNLWNNAVAVNVARSISSTASAVGRTAAQEGYNALWAWGMDEDYDPKWVDIETSAMVAGLTTFVLGMINSSAETKASKVRLEQLQREYAAKFTALQKGATTEEQAARNVLEMAKIAAETNQLLTNNQFVGQQKLVEAAQNSTTANLETLHGIWAKFSPEAQQAALDAFQAERGGNIAEYFQVSKSAPTAQPMPGLLPETTGTAAPEPTAEATSATAPGMEPEATTPLPGQNAPQMGASLPTGAELAAAAQQQAAAAAQAGNLAAAAAQADPPAAPEMAATAPEQPEITMTTPETRAPEQSLQDARALRDEGVTEAQVLQQTGWVPLSGDTYLNPATGEQVNFDGETVTIYNKNTAGAAQKPQTTETMTGGTDNAEWAGTEEGIGNSEERPADAHSGGSAGRMETGAERRSAADRIRETVNLQNRVGRLQLDKVSSKELGLQNGTSNQVNTIVPESEYTQTLKDAKKAVEEAGYTFRAVLGRMQTKNGSVDGVFDPRTRTITVRADTMQYSTEQLVQHEMFHALADGDRTIREQAIRTVKERYTEREFEAVVAEYIKQMRGIYDAADEAQHALMEDEVLADAYAGMNRFKAGATYFSEGVREAAEQRGANQIEGRSTESRGPPEQYSMDHGDERGSIRSRSNNERTNAPRTFAAGVDGTNAADVGSYENSIARTEDSVKDKITAEKYRGVNLAEDGKVYTYDFLTALPDMDVTMLPEVDAVRGADNRVDTAQVVQEGMKNARAVGTERDGKVFVENRYTGKLLMVTTNSIRHGINGATNRVLTNARLGAVVGNIVQNAVPINALYNTAKDVTGTYAMAGYATDSAGREFAAILTVEQKTGKIAAIEAYDMLHAVSGRQKKGSQADTKSQSIHSIKAAKISISDLLQIVNSTHQSILSENVLQQLGEQRSPNGDYTGKVKFSSSMTDSNVRFSPSAGSEGPQELRLPSIYDEDYVEREPETDNAAEYNQRKKELDAAREDRLLGIKPSGRMTSAQNMAFDADQQKNKQDYAQELLMALEPPKESDPVLEMPKGYMQLGQDWQMQNTRKMQEIYKRYAENTPKDRRLSEAEFWYMKQRTAKGDFNDTRQRMSEEAEALSFQRVLDRDDFEATSALDKMGVKVARSVGQYANVQQLLENDKAFRSVQKEATRVENRLQPTAKEKNFAKQVAAGVYSYADIPSTMDTEKILELADNYAAVRSFGEERITQVRSQIRQKLLNVMGVTFAKANDFKAPKAIVLNYNTAQRNMRGIFGDELGEKVNRLVFAPVIENEAERVRFINRQFDDVREFAGKDGKKAALTKQESMLVQQVIEGRAVEEAVASAEMKNAIQSAAENIKNGRDAGDEAKEWGLSRSERELAQKYARWLETLEALQDEKNVDAVRVDNAVKAYQQKFNEFYDAINDFLVAHGYQPIGFIKGYAPHLQAEDSTGKFNSVLKALGMNPEVSALPTSISGLTGDYKPGKKWNPYFLHRYSDVTNYDIASAYESYVEYMSDVLYHTDDVMTVRAMAEYFRQRYAPEDIRNEIERIQMLQNYSTDEKLEYLKDTGDVGQFDFMDRAGIEDTMQKKLDQLYADAENKTKYGMFVTYLDNYANILAGKQSMADRGPESLLGRNILNVGNKLTRVFGKAQVAGSMSSMLNQTAQLAPIIGEKGIKNVTAAIRDIMSGSLRKADFAQRSDFLTSKGGIDFLVTEPGEAIITTMFAPAEFVDRMMSAIAVRSAYLEAIQKGMDEKAAMRYADDYGRSVMGDRSKGAKPVAFHSKNPIMQMANIFQIEALNTWEHMAKDTLGYDFRQMVKEQGKTKAAAALAGVIVRTLLAAFVLNRLTDELYGGTPAPFDLVGLSANFMASGEGLTTNDWIRQVIDNGWEKISGERLFGTEERDASRGFDWQTAIEDLGYNVMNDTPYVRNIAALLGLGDETLPLPNLLGGVSDIKSAIQNHGFLSGENAEAALGLATEFVPGGRQIRKTAQGISLLARGGRYSGYGEDERMRYPVDSKDPWTAARAILFGPNALQENERFYASGAKALTDKQTQAILQLEETAGLDRFAGYDLVQSIRGIDAEDTWSSTQKAQARRALINRLDLQDEQKFMVYDTLIGAKSEDLAELMDAGLTWDEITKAYDRYQELYAEEDMKAAQKATEFARWLDTDTALTDEKKNAAKEAFKFYSMVPADAGKYDELAEGLAPDTAAEVLDLLRGLEPEDGKNQVTNVQKYSAILESNLTMADKNTAVRSVIGDSMVEKLDKIGKYGVNYADYAEFKIKFERKFPGESMSQARAEEIITNMSLTAQERAALWQVVTNTKKGDSNPYMVIVGEHVVRMLDWDQE